MSDEKDSKVDALQRTISLQSLQGDMTLFKNLKGKNLITRAQPYFDWQNNIRESGLWFVGKTSTTAPTTHCEGMSDSGLKFSGINFASQDYLSLASHPAIKETAQKAITQYGVHSAGSPALFGNTKFSQQLEQVISQFLNMKYTSLFPTGWAAGFGVIRALVKKNDHIIMDRLSHACLQEGALASTQNLHHCPHLQNQVVEAKLKEIREKDNENGILVITESLFSMDTDTPDLENLQTICRQYDAILLVDMAHDLGCMGKKGLGALELQNMIGKADIVMGSFSKTFASNGGFACINSEAVYQYFTSFSSPRTFSNALSPIQAAIILKAFEIIQSKEGEALREKLMMNILYLRKRLKDCGLEISGIPSPIVPVTIGNEGLTRLTTRLLFEEGIITNNVEFPAVAKGAARLRLQVMANHTSHDIDALVVSIKKAINKAKTITAEIDSAMDKNTSAFTPKKSTSKL